ncbi:unnamed protein product, partial [Allacma fusca]
TDFDLQDEQPWTTDALAFELGESDVLFGRPGHGDEFAESFCGVGGSAEFGQKLAPEAVDECWLL